MIRLELLEYEAEDGTHPFSKWYLGLDAVASTKITTLLARMEQGNFADVKSVGAGVHERRLDFGPGYRVYFGHDGDLLIILLGGGTKKRQQNDIALAQKRWADYKRRKKQTR